MVRIVSQIIDLRYRIDDPANDPIAKHLGHYQLGIFCLIMFLQYLLLSVAHIVLSCIVPS